MTILRNIFGFMLFLLLLVAAYNNVGKRDLRAESEAEEHARKHSIHLQAIDRGNEPQAITTQSTIKEKT